MKVKRLRLFCAFFSILQFRVLYPNCKTFMGSKILLKERHINSRDTNDFRAAIIDKTRTRTHT